jgi:hypothetical protein
MRVRYLVRLKEPIRLEDHWPVPIMGGELRVVSKDEMATAFEITLAGQSVDLAPAAQQHEKGDVKLSITVRDTLLPLVERQLGKAFTYLWCYFDVEVLIREIQIEYTAETEEEERQIEVKGWSSERKKTPLWMPYNLLTRAIMAAEAGQAPEFEATLVSAARTALLEERYIDSFRYAFLLMESLYGGGKFKTMHLKDALKGSLDFKRLVTTALKMHGSPKRPRNSDTEQLLAASPTAEAVIDHLVDKRGLYFHGNVGRKDAWRPHEQQAAEMLALLSLEIAMLISQAAAAQMFDGAFSQRHRDNAEPVGAIMAMNVSFRYREPGQTFDKKGSMNISVPGTKATPKVAVYVARKFLERFEDRAPVADLKSVTCTVRGTGQKVFDMEFHVEAGSVVSEDG